MLDVHRAGGAGGGTYTAAVPRVIRFNPIWKKEILMTRRFLTAASAALVLAMLMSLAAPAHAAEKLTRPFTAEGAAVATDLSEDGTRSTFVTAGVNSEQGPFTGQTFNTIHENGKQTGTFYFDDANGDRISFSYSIETAGDGLAGTYKVRDGTGPYAGAKGGGELVLTFTDTGVNFAMQGDISTKHD
jgi:hypothetical protein